MDLLPPPRLKLFSSTAAFTSPENLLARQIPHLLISHFLLLLFLPSLYAEY